jgi:alkaline phosphatase D
MNDENTTQAGGRRRFLQGATAGIGAMLLGRGRDAQAAASLVSAPSAFEAGTTGALIRVHATEAMRARIDFSAEASLNQARQGPAVALDRAADFAATLRLEGLTPGQTWYYRVVDAAINQPVSAIGRLKTAPAKPQPFTFAFSSCMHADYKPFRLFDVIGARDPDFFLHLGDTVYADQPRKEFAPSVAHYRRKHAVIRQDEHLQRFLSQHVSYATWDDHEIDNGAHAGHPHIGEALQVFREYWPSAPSAGDGLYRRFVWAGADFFMLDTRRFRSPQTMAEGAGKTMLGAAQKQWLLETLKASAAPFKFILTAVPFHGASADAWGTYRTERDEIVNFIRDNKLRGIVFLTGDYHLARDWTNAGTRLREYMAGPIAQFTMYQKDPKARERYQKAGAFHYGDGINFGFVRVDAGAERATLELVGADGKTMFSVDLRP